MKGRRTAVGALKEGSKARKRLGLSWLFRLFYVMLLVVAAAGFFAGLRINAQQNTLPQYPARETGMPAVPPMGDGRTNNASPYSAMPSEEDKKILEALNLQRHKDLASETERLVQLAGEVQAEVKKDPAQPPTAEQLAQLAQIEKLAHVVQHRMKESWSR